MPAKYPKTVSIIPSLAFAIFLFYFSVVNYAKAETMRSGNYTIRFGNFNMTSGKKTSASYTLTDTVGQTAAAEFTAASYTVKAGFQYIYTLFNFAFSISDLSIDFGTLTPNSFSTASHTLTVSAPGQGYTVTAFEDHPLERSGGDQIPDTTCNAGTCTQTSAGVWTSTSAFGFGFNMSGNDIPADFTDSTYFRQFADASAAESPATVMSTSAAGSGRQATVTYKVNISPTQSAGDYENLITFIATPSF